MKPIEFNETNDISKYLNGLIGQDNYIIVIDGEAGAGKTTVAKNIALSLSAYHVEIDKYLDHNMGGYVRFIDHVNLRSGVMDALDKGEPLIIEGICVLEIMKEINLQYDILVYVKRIGADGTWFFGYNFENDKSPMDIKNEHARAEKLLNNLLPTLKNGGSNYTVQDEIIDYHFKYKPHQIANIIYKRIEEF